MHPKCAWVVRQLRTPPDQLKRKILRRLAIGWYHRLARWQAVRRPTYLKAALPSRLAQCVPPLDYAPQSDIRRELTLLTDLYLAHRFDLLGSGWVKVGYGRVCNGFAGYSYSAPTFPAPDAKGNWLAARINAANLSESQRIWRLVDKDYEPIDWQLDFKSGYRWTDSAWYLDIEIPADAPGADIKVPWELARCQHLPQLALAYAAKTNEPGNGNDLHAREFRNQVLDFLANNPPGHGVNWRCTMDVSIRIANWLIARDLFMGAGAVFDAEFETLLGRSAREHGLHIIENLEWSESGRSNHYLSNVVGLLIVAAYLPPSDESDAWAGWALQELLLEVGEQFDTRGCNREGSTSYHRLSSEMAIYGAAFSSHLLRMRPHIVHCGIRRMPRLSGWGGRPDSVLAKAVADLTTGALPAWFWSKLFGMGQFVIALSKPDGLVPQVGDNDSGRFLKLQTTFDLDDGALSRQRYAHLDGCNEMADGVIYPNQVDLDHRHLPRSLAAFFDDKEFSVLASPSCMETVVLRGLAGVDRQIPMEAFPECRIGQAGDLDRYLSAFDKTPVSYRQCYEFALPVGYLPGKLSASGFIEFGVYVLRGPCLYAAFRCGPAEQYGQGSHLHHDQLSLELVIDGDSLALDPGTYVYTPLPVGRNAYRSLHAHFAPWPASTPRKAYDERLFVFNNTYRAECLYFQPDGMVGRHFGFGGSVHRMITIEEKRLVVRDFSESIPLERAPFDGNPPRFHNLPYSDKYGGQLR